MKIYLIDYENVHEAGLAGLNKLDALDEVYIFYSKNANKLTFDLMDKIISSKATVKSVKVDSGSSNALDFQLSFFAGQLSKTYDEADIYIVSQDKGYDCLFTFNNSNAKLKISRVLNLSGHNSAAVKQELQQKVANSLKDIQFDNVNKNETINFIVNLLMTYKTKVAINNNINKKLKDGALTSAVCRAIKPLLKDKS